MDAVELDEACRVLAVWTLEFAAWGDRCLAAAKAARHPVKGDILKRGLQPVQLHIAHTITITSRHT